jgi:nicotinate dehydrogenase subunit B
MNVISRRQFAKGAGGFVLAFSLSPSLAAAQEAAPAAKRLPGSLEANKQLDSWIAINEDGTVTILIGKVEIGQGVTTALAQIAGEELDVGMARITVISGDTARTPNEGVTAGSNSMEQSGVAMRFAAAEARAILLERAAKKLNAAASDLTVSDGTIGGPGGAKTTYWEVAKEGKFSREATASVKPKPPEKHVLVGQKVPRIDIPAKVAGGAIFIQDMRIPGMLYGRPVRPPSPWAELVSVDETVAKKMPGVVAVVRDGSWLGVVTEREEQAIAARAALKKAAKWRDKANFPDSAKLPDFLRSLRAETETVSEKKNGTPSGTVIHAANYSRPYLAHASIGPACAIARVDNGTLTIWSSTQNVWGLRQDLARVLGEQPSKIRVAHAQGAGCYGHNDADDAALDAAILSRAVGGRPVKVQTMRDDAFLFEPYGSAMAITAKAVLGADGSVADYEYQVWSNSHNMRPGPKEGSNLLGAWYLEKPFPVGTPGKGSQPSGAGDRNAVPGYEFASQRIIHHFLPEMPLRVSALRTLGGFANVFATESFMDELAEKAKADPVEYRLRHLKDERGRAVIQAVAERAGWKPGAKSDGIRGRGFAYARYETIKAYVALVADITVDHATGKIRIVKVTAAADAGEIVNPDGLSNQIEGGIIQSISWTLKEQIRFDRQHVLTRDWETYPILTFSEVPEIDVVLIDRPKEKFLGAGEASQGPTPAAIANAIYHATGLRLRDLPLTPDKVKAGLA